MGGWIRLQDWMPEEKTLVLGAFRDIKGKYFFEVCFCQKYYADPPFNLWCDRFGRWLGNVPTHVMMLPEAPDGTDASERK